VAPNQNLTAFIEVVHAFLNDRHDERLKTFLADWPDMEIAFRDIAPQTLPVLAHMRQAVGTASENTEGLVNRLAILATTLAWGQTYSADDFGAGFLEKYGWSEFIGLRGPIPSERVSCGVLMLGPGVEYPRHRHEAEEVYIPLSGQALWLQGDQDWTFRELGQAIFHAPWVTHAMKTGPSPLLALYLWRAGDLTQKSLID